MEYVKTRSPSRRLSPSNQRKRHWETDLSKVGVRFGGGASDKVDREISTSSAAYLASAEGLVRYRAMEPRVSLVTLGVRDLERALAYYRDGLGWQLSSASSDEIAFLKTGGVVVALFPRDRLAADANLEPGSGGFGGITLAQNVPERDDVDRVLLAAVAAGGHLLKAAEDAHWGGRSGYVADPDGYPWEVAWNPFFSLRPDGAIQLPD